MWERSEEFNNALDRLPDDLEEKLIFILDQALIHFINTYGKPDSLEEIEIDIISVNNGILAQGVPGWIGLNRNALPQLLREITSGDIRTTRDTILHELVHTLVVLNPINLQPFEILNGSQLDTGLAIHGTSVIIRPGWGTSTTAFRKIEEGVAEYLCKNLDPEYKTLTPAYEIYGELIEKLVEYRKIGDHKQVYTLHSQNKLLFALAGIDFEDLVLQEERYVLTEADKAKIINLMELFSQVERMVAGRELNQITVAEREQITNQLWANYLALDGLEG